MTTTDRRTRRALPTLIAGVALVAAAPALSAQETIPLEFGWEPGWSATVSYAAANAMSMPMMSDSTTQEFGYRVTVSDAPGGLRVDYSDFEFPALGMFESLTGVAEAEVEPQQLETLMSAMLPSLIVDGEGDFVDIVDFENPLGTMRDRMEAQLQAQSGGAPNPMSGMMEGMFARETWVDNAAQQWQGMVGWWAGREMTVGEVVTVEGERVMPMLPTGSVPFVAELELLGRTACTEGGSDMDCVELRAEVMPNQQRLEAEFRDFMDQMLAEMGVPAGMQFSIDEFSVESETILVVEPGTLRPRRVTNTSTTTQSMNMMGQQQTTTNRQSSTVVYDWGN